MALLSCRCAVRMRIMISADFPAQAYSRQPVTLLLVGQCAYRAARLALLLKLVFSLCWKCCGVVEHTQPPL